MVWFFGVGARAFVVALFGAVVVLLDGCKQSSLYFRVVWKMGVLQFTPCSQSFTNALKRAGIDTPKGQNTYYATLSLRNL
jgi:hypothetical protein